MQKWFFVSVVVEFSVIAILGLRILQRSKNFLGVKSVNPIRKSTIQSSSQSLLKYFYEPVPDTKQLADKTAPDQATYTINTDSLNERFNYSVDKLPKTFRIITLGDSYTFGLYVDTKDNWTEVLEDKLQKLTCNNIQKFEVINLGVHGYDIQYSTERYRIRGQKYNPDLLLWFIKLNNFYQINELIIPTTNQLTKKLKSQGTYDVFIKQQGLYGPWLKAMEETYNRLGDTGVNKYNAAALEKINEYYKGPLVLMTYPDTKQVYKNLLLDEVKKRPQTYLDDVLANTSENDSMHFKGDLHPTTLGHKTIANDVFEYLTVNKLIPCD